MKDMASYPPQVVVHVHGSVPSRSSSKVWGGDYVANASAGSFRRHAHVSGGAGPSVSEPVSEPSTAPAHAFDPMDPHRMALEQPVRWARYVNTMWPLDDVLVAMFHVDIRTARNWRKGLYAPRAHHMAMALRQHPAKAFAMLIAAE